MVDKELPTDNGGGACVTAKYYTPDMLYYIIQNIV